MEDQTTPSPEEAAIARWRTYLLRRRALQTLDLAELEDHLREEISVLRSRGLDGEEAFLVAVKRLGRLDPLSREFAEEHSGRLWKQLVLPRTEAGEPARGRADATVAVALGVAAGAAVKLPSLLGVHDFEDGGFHARNAGLLVLPFLAAYFAWKRRLPARTLGWLAAAFAAGAVCANAYPYSPSTPTAMLTALHLPIALWLAVGVAYAGGRWGEVAGRMDFIRFSGELFIYYVLIALGGGVLSACMALTFRSIGVNPEPLFQQWILPCGAAGALLVAAWLAEAKQGVVENMAPVLTRIFTPLFTAVLLAFLATLMVTGRGVVADRDLLLTFDLLLAVVLGLLLYAVSARDPLVPPGFFDHLQVLLVLSALAVDAVALWAIGSRIGEYGVSPNRAAALGENLLLLVNLAWSAILYLRFLRGRGSFGALEQWQVRYLPAYAAWAAFVAAGFPLIFG